MGKCTGEPCPSAGACGLGVLVLLPSEMPLATLSSLPCCWGETCWGETFRGLSASGAEQGVSVHHPPGRKEKGAFGRCWGGARLSFSAALSGDGFGGRGFLRMNCSGGRCLAGAPSMLEWPLPFKCW